MKPVTKGDSGTRSPDDATMEPQGLSSGLYCKDKCRDQKYLFSRLLALSETFQLRQLRLQLIF